MIKICLVIITISELYFLVRQYYVDRILLKFMKDYQPIIPKLRQMFGIDVPEIDPNQKDLFKN